MTRKVPVDRSRAVNRWISLIPLFLTCSLFYFVVIVIVVSRSVGRAGLPPGETPVAASMPGPTASASILPPPGPTRSTLPTPTLLPTLERVCNYDCLRSCMSRLPEIVAVLEPGEYDEAENRQVRGVSYLAGIYDLASYRIVGEEIVHADVRIRVPERLRPAQEDRELHYAVWDFFATIIPERARSPLTNFILFTDGQYTGSIAYVSYRPPYYFLYVDIYDIDDEEMLVSTLVHETAHIFTYNGSQLSPYPPPPDYSRPGNYDEFQAYAEACGGYYNGRFCAYPDSYISLFYERFWSGRWDVGYEIYAASHSGDDPGFIAERLYRARPGDFVTEYAATNPLEDLAESFEAFVLWPGPATNRIADQKILFFYEFPELVEMRSRIIQGICDYADRHGPGH